ncbi:MAG: imidazole glycerol phosphate synthase subunit HisH, partial [Chloroflexota bacterium]|nr:imidazole glycerol phosphate synthase subunit HisH [Chloroflexota bacterium]
MRPVEVAVVDYGAGNLRSVAKALEYLGAAPIVTNDARVLAKAQAIILPGQGACDSAMRALQGLDLVEPVRE